MTDRIKAILAAGDVAGLPEIARVLALDTDLAPEAAETVFAAATKDINAAPTRVGDTNAPPAAGQEADSSISAHGLGAAEVVGAIGKEATKESWGKAVAAVNAGMAVN